MLIIQDFLFFFERKTLHNLCNYAGFCAPYYNIPSNNKNSADSQVKFQPSYI